MVSAMSEVCRKALMEYIATEFYIDRFSTLLCEHEPFSSMLNIFKGGKQQYISVASQLNSTLFIWM
jgi:hypothetical protein